MNAWSLHFRKAYEVIGFAYNADLHCTDCALKHYTPAQLYGSQPAIDSELNPIHAVFLGDEFDSPPTCGDCFEPLN